MPQKILLIEDETIIMELLQKKLIGAGFDVTVARDGKAGLDALREAKPDLVLLDIIMPKMTGFEVMEEMQKDPELKDIPVIIISNSGQPVEISKIKQLGARDWLIKTEFDPEEVIKKIRQQIGD